MEEEIPPLDVSEGVFLDNGAFGSVFLLSTQSHRFPLAVKQIRFRESDRETTTEQVRMEYKLLQRLSSNDHIVKVYDLQSKPDQLLIIMEYMSGGTLQKLIQESGGLSEELSLDLICQLLVGVEYMISRHVINRDIKPTNILLNETRTSLKIADFGCGRRLWSQRETTGLCTDRGTLAYKAPEMFRNDEITGRIHFGTNSEIWSCGMVFYEMLVGRHMYFEYSDAQIVMIIGNMKTQSDLVYPYFKLVSNGTKQLFDQLLTVDRHKRPNAQEALEMATNVRNMQQSPLNQTHLVPQNNSCSTRAPASTATAIESYPPRSAGNRIAPEARFTIDQNDSCHPQRPKPKYAICITIAIIVSVLVVASAVVYAVMYHRKKDKSVEDFGSIYLFGGAGGLDPNETLRTVQVYSPFKPAATSIPENLNFPMGEERAGHVACVLTNGIVLIAGGSRNGGDYATQSTLYFNRSAIHMPYTEGPDLLEPRYWASGAVLNGRFYVCGGWSFRNSCEYLENNGSDYHWMEGVPMLVGRDGPVMTSLKGHLYVMAGYNTNHRQKWLSQVERFDPATQKWTQVASLNTGRSGSAAATFEGKIIICGGDSSLPRILPCESYDPTQDKWTQIAPNNVLRLSPAMVVVRGSLYILGGQGQTTVERYLKEEDRWETLELELEIPRQSTTAVGFPHTI